MCAGAMVLARIDRLVYAAADPKAGAAGSLQDLCNDPRLNHRFPVEQGLRAEEASALLKEYFRARRSAGCASPGPRGRGAMPHALRQGLVRRPGHPRSRALPSPLARSRRSVKSARRSGELAELVEGA